MAKYAIWDGTSAVYTPSGRVYTAEEWKARFGWYGAPGAVMVVSAGRVNGAFVAELGEMKESYLARGCDFSDCTDEKSVLDAMEAFDRSATANALPDSAERIAAALEYLSVLLTEDSDDDV